MFVETVYNGETIYVTGLVPSSTSGRQMMLYVDSSDNLKFEYLDIDAGTIIGTGSGVQGDYVFVNDQSTLDTTTFTIKGTAGKEVVITWGDGDETVCSMDGSSNAYTHDYSGTGTYTVSFTGELDEIIEFTCQETTISGNGSWIFEQFSVTKLVVLDLTGTGITFGTSEVTAFTALTSFIVRSCSNVTGDIADLNGMTLLTSLFLDSSGITDFTDGLLPDRDACEIDIANLGVSSTEVSNFFIRLNTASTASTKTVDAGGTTPILNAAGLTAGLELRVKGWTVTATGLEAYFINNQSSLDTTTFTIAGTNAKVVTINWGDGNTTEITMDGSSSSHDYTHDYASTGTYNVLFSGDLNEITYFQCNESSISGDIAWLSGLTSLTTLRLNLTSVTGDISNLSGLTSLTYLRLNLTSVTGDISNLSGLTSLTYLRLYSTSVTGDISNLSGLTSLTYLRLENTGVDTYTQGILPDWDACNIYIYNLGLSQQEVDDFLGDLDTASSASTKTLSIYGTNSAPSATGRAAILSLVSKGWTVIASNLEETGTVTLANMKQSLVDGTAFIDIGADISTAYAGADSGAHAHFMEVMDSAGKIASGWIGAIGGGETLDANIVDNEGFEAGGTGGDFDGGSEIDDGSNDDFTSWSETIPGGRVEATATVHGGSVAVKLINTTGNVYSTLKLWQDVSDASVDDGVLCKLSFWARGDGINESLWSLYDVGNGNYIQTYIVTGNTTTSYIQVVFYFVCPIGYTNGRIQLAGSSINGGVVYYDDVALKPLTDCHTNGVHIISTVDGSTQNWTDVEAGFDYNDASGYTYAIYAS